MPGRILYLHGFASSPASRKARFFAERFAGRGVSLEIPDLAGPDGFERLTITGQLKVIERAAAGEPVSLMGSSLGGYLAALYAARHPDTRKVALLAPAFAFSTRWSESMGPGRIEQWKREGLPVYHYGDKAERRVGYQLIEDARGYEDYPDVRQPCLVFHGKADDVVPASLSEQFAGSRWNVTLRLMDSDHELLNVLEPMWESVAGFFLAA